MFSHFNFKERPGCNDKAADLELCDTWIVVQQDIGALSIAVVVRDDLPVEWTVKGVVEGLVDKGFNIVKVAPCSTEVPND